MLFEQGKSEEAMAELAQALGKPVDDMTLTFTQNTEEAYRSAGLTVAEAKMTALYQSTKTELLGFRHLADHLRNLRKFDIAAGNDGDAQSSRDLQLAIAREVQNGGFIVDTLLAMTIEKGVLKEINTPESQARLKEIEEQRRVMTEQALKIPDLMQDQSIPQSDWILYFDRSKLFGEQAANEWILRKYPDR